MGCVFFLVESKNVSEKIFQVICGFQILIFLESKWEIQWKFVLNPPKSYVMLEKERKTRAMRDYACGIQKIVFEKMKSNFWIPNFDFYGIQIGSFWKIMFNIPEGMQNVLDGWEKQELCSKDRWTVTDMQRGC